MRKVHLLLALVAFAPVAAQDHGSITGNPFSSPEDRLLGMKVFRTTCAACHGLEGGGGSNGPSLITGAFKHGDSDAALIQTIMRGVPDTPMTAYPLDPPTLWRVIAYIRSLNRSRPADQSLGDAAKGAEVFAAQGCARCHRAMGAGAFTGPDLSAIGSHRSPAQLKRSLLDPDADVSSDYWSLRARTKSGQSIAGIRMNEDMDSFQIREDSGRLRSIRKADLAAYEIVHTSPMPAFQGKLQPAEVDDLVAYLAGLRAEEPR